jgi:hypothetical protein
MRGVIQGISIDLVGMMNGRPQLLLLEKWKDSSLPIQKWVWVIIGPLQWRQGWRKNRVACSARKAMVNIVILMQSYPQLLKFLLASQLCSSKAACLHGACKQRKQDAQNGQNNKEFQQREGAATHHPHGETPEIVHVLRRSDIRITPLAFLRGVFKLFLGSVRPFRLRACEINASVKPSDQVIPRVFWDQTWRLTIKFTSSEQIRPLRQ